MDYLLASLFSLACLGMAYRMLRARDVVDFQMGVIGIFSIGYYCIPVWFKGMSTLQYVDEYRIAQIVFLFFLFGVFVLIGTWIGRRIVPKSIAFKTDALDKILVRRRPFLTAAAFLCYIYYYTTQDITSYAADDFKAYFDSKGPFDAIIAAFAQLALGLMAINIALAWKDRKRVEFYIYGGMFGVCIYLLLFSGQRLALISPIVMLMAALALTNQIKRASRMLIVAVIALLLVSPLAVYVRQSTFDKRVQDTRGAVSEFTYGDNPITSIFQSIIDRGDLVDVSINMKPRIDNDPSPGFKYYMSVLLNPIPRIFFPGGDKPYPLSVDGRPEGEQSIYSWRILVGNSTGSLSTFGGIVAYRELGWVGVLLNGLMTGVFFVFVARWLGQGGVLAGVYYVNLFVSLSVMKVPPSFWEALYALMPMLPMLLGVFIVNMIVSRHKRRVGRVA